MEDFQECLKLQLKHLDPDSRLLAETHYQLGLTYSLNLQYNEAIKQLNSSTSVIQSRLGKHGLPLQSVLAWIENLSSQSYPLPSDKLQRLLEKAEGPEALPEERKEMGELKALLPEIQEKVEDAMEGLKSATTAAEAVKDALVSHGLHIDCTSALKGTVEGLVLIKFHAPVRREAPPPLRSLVPLHRMATPQR